MSGFLPRPVSLVSRIHAQLSWPSQVWPPAYRAALAEGLFVARDGHLSPEIWSVRLAACVLAPLADQNEAVTEMVIALEAAPLGGLARRQQVVRREIQAEMAEAARLLEPDAQQAWAALRQRFSIVSDR